MCNKICNFQPFLKFLVSNPTNLATAHSILPLKISFPQLNKIYFFLPRGGRFKTVIFGFFSKLKKDINKRFAPADYPIVASTNMSYSPLHQFDVESTKIIIKTEIEKIFQNLKFSTCHKICNFQPILTFLMSSPTKLAAADSILPLKLTFLQLIKIFYF